MNTAAHAVESEIADLDALIGDLTALGMDDEIVEVNEEESPIISDEIVEAAIADVEAAEARQEIYASQEVESVESDADKPQTDEATVEPTETPKKEKKAKAPKAPKPAVPKIASSKKADVLRHRLGEKIGEYLVFDASDLELDEAALAAKQEQFLTDLDDLLADKVGDKALMLFDWMSKGKAVSELNEVIKRALNLLIAEGELTSGDKGNLQLDLLKKPYSIGTARSQANQIFCLFPALGITTKEKGKMALNPNSILMDVYRGRIAA